MAVYKDGEKKWRAVYRFTDWTGKRKQTQKRGFNTEREAQAWEREQLRKVKSDVDMTFESFAELYREDVGARIKETTWETKNSIIDKKLIPYFGKKRMSDIKPKDIIAWQNEMMNYRDEHGNPYSPVYLKTLHNQLSTIFNHAVKFYGLSENPAAKAGNMGKAKNKEKEFWTKDEYLKFIDEMLDKPISFYAFEMLYWTGIRLGELLALTSSDFDFERKTVTINKSYQRIGKKDIITSPKTEKSNRVINMPDFLCEEMKEYIHSLYGVTDSDRIFPISKSYLHHEMDRGTKAAGVKRIPIHSIRHSHISLLIDLGFSAVAIANRVGHESIDITYNYAHMFPSTQLDMANKLNEERGEDNG